MKVPITQSENWQKLQEALGETSFFVTGKNYQFLAILKRTKVGNYLYCPYGPVLKDKTALNDALKALRDLADEQGAIFIRIEPVFYLSPAQLAKSATKLGLKLKKSHDLNPKETWLLDLAGTDDDLRAKLPSRLLRYHKSAAKKGITIETSKNPDDIAHLLKLQKALAKEKGINTFSEHYLKTELAQPFATLYLVKYQAPATAPATNPSTDPSTDRSANPSTDQGPSIIAAGLVFDDQTTRYNLQGAQSEQGRALHATGILTIQLILDAKSNGQQLFDFWGIAPDGAPSTHPWTGFTAFKKTFAGYEETHTGTYDLILKPSKYRLYGLARAIHRKVRKS